MPSPGQGGSGLPSPAGHGSSPSGSGLPSPAGHGPSPTGSGTPHDSSGPRPHDTAPQASTGTDTRPHDTGTKPHDPTPHDSGTKPHDADAKPHDTGTKPHDTDTSGADDPKPHDDKPDTPADPDAKGDDGRDDPKSHSDDASGPATDKDGPGNGSDDSNRSPKGHDLTPHFDNDAMAAQGDGYKQELERILPNEAERERYQELSKKLSTELSQEDARLVADVRNQIKVGEGDIVTKVLHPNAVETYLPAKEHDAGSEGARRQGSVAGSIARGVDVHDINTPMGLRDGLALDDKGEGWTPIKDKADSAMQLRYKMTDAMAGEAFMPYGGPEKKDWDPAKGPFDPQKHYVDAAEKAHYDAKAQQMYDAGGGSEPIKRGADPFTGTGSTGGGVPEWIAKPAPLPDRAEIWEVRDGEERLHAVYEKGRGWYQVPQQVAP